MQTADFNFHLPPELIAQHPTAQRDGSRLLVLHRGSGQIEHRLFPELARFLRPSDVLVLNNSRVIPARLRGTNTRTGGAFEILLLEEIAVNDWWTMMKPGKRARVGTEILINEPPPLALHIPGHRAGTTGPLAATVVEINPEGHRRLRFRGAANVLDDLLRLGEIPLPPYIHRERAAAAASDPSGEDVTRYQTVFAQPPGSVAAPTAGLHFTPELLDTIRARGVEVHFVTLHVGLGTFAPVKAQRLEAHVMHEERYEVSAATAQAVNRAKAEGRRVIAVGTTSVRVLESAVDATRHEIVAGRNRTRIFIHPPHAFKVVDALLTNFHLPCSTLLMLVSAFAAPGDLRGREMVLAAYANAIRERYRFFSYGDAMLLC